MSTGAKAPSPPQAQLVPPNAPMPQPATPRASTSASASAKSDYSPHSDVAPDTPGSRSRTTPLSLASPSPARKAPSRDITSPAKTPHRSLTPARTPGGGILTCTSDADRMDKVEIHTAICTVCDQRNKGHMKRCPGCTWQICETCREKRESQGRSLTHGSMGTPGGLGSGLGSGKVVRRRLLDMPGSPTPAPGRTPARQHDDEQMMGAGEKGTTKGKGKASATAKPASKKRIVSSRKSKAIIENDSSGDDFIRAKNSVSTPQNVAPPHGPVSQEASWEGWQGVNTPGHWYEQHFLGRQEPVVTNRVISIPESVRRMGDKTPRLTAVQKLEARKNEMWFQAQKAQAEELKVASTVRGFAEAEALKAQNHIPDLNTDEKEELTSAIKEGARKWALRAHDGLPPPLQTTVERGLDMRLDHIDTPYTRQLFDVIRECASRKLDEFIQDRGTST
ncbi:hypothetical protein SNOG_12391 [Parastagonospora nodorum SN15]|uniref:Uncharacterized protein n=1 Tax=Phaeosphaeria nodorum (strain SN15 / ATCC MYA-4574 / FGSC 10173) TaxID=321614 RepID=Q0U773_PHANO|nr:hypothetical protein SNOG_12391 [Parastagonospora nodorum SN15]EAT80204.2 hypothetical protein SNOG_12391 [Parastagonospora nodorum SN15]